MITIFSNHPTEARVDIGLKILESYLEQPQIPAEDIRIIREVNTRLFLDRVFINVGGKIAQQIMTMVTHSNFHRDYKQRTTFCICYIYVSKFECHGSHFKNQRRHGQSYRSCE